MERRSKSNPNGVRYEIYAGTVCVGSVVRRESGWRAIGAGGHDLGGFATEAAARTSLLDHHLHCDKTPSVTKGTRPMADRFRYARRRTAPMPYAPRVEMRLRRLTAHVHRLGPVAMLHLLQELVDDAELEAALQRYSRLDASVVHALGGDRFPPPPLALAHGGAR